METEKCQYCEDGVNNTPILHLEDGDELIHILISEGLLSAYYSDNTVNEPIESSPIKYCPMCGSSITKTTSNTSCL